MSDIQDIKNYALKKRERGDSFKSILDYLKSKGLEENTINEIIAEIVNKEEGTPEQRTEKRRVEKKKTEHQNLEIKKHNKKLPIYLLISIGFFVLGNFLYIRYGHETRTFNSILSYVLILLSWGVFFEYFFRHPKIKRNNWLMFMLSMVLMMVTVTVSDQIVYGGSYGTQKELLDTNSPYVKTVIKEKEYQPRMRIKNHVAEAGWNYKCYFEINGTQYVNTTFSTTDIYNVGDEVKVYYSVKNPKINKIITEQ